MKCLKCQKEIEDNLKICPSCGAIQEEKHDELRYYNHAHDTSKAHNLILTEHEIEDYDFSYKDVSNGFDLFKKPIFYFFNVFFAIALPFVFMFLELPKELAIAITVCLIIENIIIGMITYKSHLSVVYGSIPVFNLLYLYKHYLPRYKEVYSFLKFVFFFFFSWNFAFFIILTIIAASTADSWVYIIIEFTKLQFFILFTTYTFNNFRMFFHIGEIFGLNKYLTMFFPIFYLPYIAFNKKLYYHEEDFI